VDKDKASAETACKTKRMGGLWPEQAALVTRHASTIGEIKRFHIDPRACEKRFFVSKRVVENHVLTAYIAKRVQLH